MSGFIEGIAAFEAGKECLSGEREYVAGYEAGGYVEKLGDMSRRQLLRATDMFKHRSEQMDDCLRHYKMNAETLELAQETVEQLRTELNLIEKMIVDIREEKKLSDVLKEAQS